ncbi:hypothetical protein [Ruminiclostridium cellulolyticum]|uniref:Uncharacterized protein n=1 Tax=Ruminiclostridium cellulolyticum (strain ATCC 35319 / DSM 5812 / JCM 6584 / H10) TaxID=394503 RepID=B8I0D7_RUMCH|nr:hypothetical protein [Ruminiclostridium cellulolyticum]ACL77463.1 hypothetical protein Ccel_3172 [Ruminiclostridium cellulolyticum H10]
MRLEELKNVRNFKITDIEHFKSVVIEAIERTCHWKEFDEWLHEEYENCSNESNQYRAKIIVINESYRRDTTKCFKVDSKNISSVTIYSIFYTDTCGGGFVISDINLFYDEIKSFEKLLK